VHGLRAMKGDAVIRVPRAAWKKAMGFALSVDRELREVIGAAVDEYVEAECGRRETAEKEAK
jgi:hypothetical protein